MPDLYCHEGLPSGLTTWTVPLLSVNPIRPSSRIADDCSTSFGGCTAHLTEPFGLRAQKRLGNTEATYIVPSRPIEGLPSVS